MRRWKTPIILAGLLLMMFASRTGADHNHWLHGIANGEFERRLLEQLRGAELWRDQVNAAGGIKAGGKSYQVKFVNYDDESNPQRVQQLYTRLILQDKANFLFSPYSSGLYGNGGDRQRAERKDHDYLGRSRGKRPMPWATSTCSRCSRPASQYLTSALDVLKAKDREEPVGACLCG